MRSYDAVLAELPNRCRHELSDVEWEFVRPLLPESLRGRKRLDDRRILNGIVWKFRTGTGLAGRARAIRAVGHAPHPFPQVGVGRDVRDVARRGRLRLRV